jgi:hypothetical protein
VISNWKIEAYFDEKHQDRYLVSVKGDKEDVYRVVIKFDEFCQSPFPLKGQQVDFNWGFFMNTSLKEERQALEKYLKRLAAAVPVPPESAPEKNETEEHTAADTAQIGHLAKEIGGVIKELTVHGISQEEAKQAIKHKDVVLPTEIKVPGASKAEEQATVRIKPMYLQEEKELPEEPLMPEENLVRMGFLYPDREKEKVDIFITGLDDVLQAVKHHSFTLEKVYEGSFLPDEKLSLKDLLDIYNRNKLEVLLIFLPNFRILPEAKNLGEALKRLPKKRKVLIKAIQLKKIASRATFVDLVVDIALFKGRGIGDFQN